MDSKTTAPVKVSYADLLELPDDGLRHELIDGVHYVTPSPSVPHQSALGNLYLVLGPFVKERGLGRIFFAPLDVVLTQYDVVEPDLLFIAGPRAGIIKEAFVEAAPDLVVEVLSPSTRRRDAAEKLRLYEKFGVAEYWMVDTERRRLEVFRRIEGRLKLVATPSLDGEAAFTSPLFPGLVIALDQIFG